MRTCLPLTSSRCRGRRSDAEEALLRAPRRKDQEGEKKQTSERFFSCGLLGLREGFGGLLGSHLFLPAEFQAFVSLPVFGGQLSSSHATHLAACGEWLRRYCPFLPGDLSADVSFPCQELSWRVLSMVFGQRLLQAELFLAPLKAWPRCSLFS